LVWHTSASYTSGSNLYNTRLPCPKIQVNMCHKITSTSLSTGSTFY
jgi:hypothetical protein